MVNFEEMEWEEIYQGKPKMNGGCVTTKETNPETICVCDSYDGCNSSGVTKLSLILFCVIVFTRFAF